MDKIFVYPQQQIVNWLYQLSDFELLLFSELNTNTQTTPIVIAAWSPKNNTSYLSGVGVAVNLRLQNYSNPIIVLTFRKEATIHQRDETGITLLPGTNLIQLPCTRETISKAISSSVQIEEIELQSFRGKTFVKQYGVLLKQLKHGGHHDFVNNVTGPLRAACVIAKYQPETMSNVHQQIGRINNHLSSTGTADFLKIYSYFTNGEMESEKIIPTHSFDFFEELKSFMNTLNAIQINLDICINKIDNLNQKFSFLKEI